ncbi:MAG: hypothetical protein HY822_13505 [Acidobacteria bacterium]|nr:hypothetical protein [Acidobacteriota bacterium]
MQRRFFLPALASAALRPARPAAKAIRRIVLAPVEGRFHKFVTMNRYDKAPKGHTYTNTLVRIQTGEGAEGVGVMGYAAPDDAFRHALRGLLGALPLDLYEMREGRIAGRAPAYAALLTRYKHLDGPLFDLVGKLTGRPAWRLLGESARERIEVYDGTLYFSDVWFAGRGVRAVVEEAEEACRKGYRGLKLKVGRGFQWMEQDQGDRRDIEVVRAVRRAVGPRVKILADANDGYQQDYDRAWRFIAETASAGIHWYEELYPEDVARYSRLRQDLRKAGIRSLIADGESVHRTADFEPYLRPVRLIDVLQMDIRTEGFLENAAAARLAQAAGGTCVPHNWGSQVGGCMGMQLSKAFAAVPAAEDDRSACDALIADGYQFRDGACTVPDRPGLSLHVDEAVYNRKYRAGESVVE